jgi:hypothetical protein
MSIACTAFSFGSADGNGAAGAIEGAESAAGGEASAGAVGAFARNDDGGPVSVRIESSTGVSFADG